MALSDLKLSSETVVTPGGEFSVRGLTIEDLTALFRRHSSVMSGLFDRMVSDPEAALEVSAVLGARLLDEAPDLMVEVIAMAADEPERADVVRKLPFPCQVDALEKIGALTFASEAELKKALETVILMASGATKTLQGLQT